MSDMTKDPKQQISEAMQEVRNAMGQLRESVVLLVMRRNKLSDEVKRQDRLVADLRDKAQMADGAGKTQLASELQNEMKSREAELANLRERLAKAEVEAESAKIRLPEEETRLSQQLSDLQSQLIRLSSSRIMESGSGLNDTFARATEKVHNMQSEISARQELSGTPPTAPPKSADEMLAALESKLGTPAPQEAHTQPANFLEFDAPKEASIVPNFAEPMAEVVEEPFAEVMAEPVIEVAQEAELDIPVEAALAPPSEDEALTTEIEARRAELSVAYETVPAEGSAPTLEIEASLAPLPEPDFDFAPLPVPIVASEVTPEMEATVATPAIAESEPPLFAIFVKPEKESSPMNSENRVRVAAIGTGAIFRGAHLPVYPDIANAQLVALCDPDKKAQELTYQRFASLTQAKAEQAKERNDVATADRLLRDLDAIKIYEDLSQVAAEVKPDLVDICTQPVLHTPLAIQALEAGINVMCEKPVSRCWLETIPLLETIQRTGKLYQHNENWLFDPDYYTAKKLIDAGAIGEPILMFLATAHGGPEGNPKFWNSDFGGGGALLDNGIHAIGASWFMSGLDKRPTVVKAADPFGMTIRMPNRILEGRYQKVSVDDDAHILIRFEHPDNLSWTTAHVEGSWSYRDSPDTCIIGSTGKIVFRDEDGKRFAIVIDSYDREQRRIQVSGANWQHWPSSFYGEIQNMVECVRAGVPSIMGADFGAECSAVVGAAYLSQKRGRAAVTVEDYKRFALGIRDQYPNDLIAACNALIEAQLSAVRG